jgi:PAS domain S-box-containing protein
MPSHQFQVVRLPLVHKALQPGSPIGSLRLDSKRLLAACVAALAGLAIALISADLSAGPAGIATSEPIVWVAILALSVGAEHITFRIHRGWTSAAGTLPHIAAAFLFPPGQAELIGLLGALSYGVSRRLSAPKVLLNAAVAVLAIGAAAHVALGFGSPELLTGHGGWWGPPIALLASGVYYVVSVASVSVVVALDRHQSMWRLARAKFGFLALADLGLGLFGATLALVLTVAPGWAPAMTLPALLVYLAKRSHEALRGSETRLKAMVDSALDAIITLDVDGRVVLFNESAEKMFGRRASDAIGRSFDDFLPPAVEARNGESSAYEMARRDTGEEFPVEISRSQTDVLGERLSTLIVRDATQRSRLEAERVQLLTLEQKARADAQAALHVRNEFLSVAAHELRTPVTSLRAYGQLLLRVLTRGGDLEPGRVERALTAIDRQSAKLAHLVSHLLDISFIESGQMTLDCRETDLTLLIQEAVEVASARSAIHTLAVDAPPRVLATVDAVRLEQVVTNLLDNAIKYSPHGGPVDVVLTIPRQGGFRLEVRDQGVGIPAELREHIFERFYQGHAAEYGSGMGLGLYISRQIVELHGGTIVAEFPSEGGTRVVVTLPPGGPEFVVPGVMAQHVRVDLT